MWRLIQRLLSLPKQIVTPLALVLIVLIGAVDYVTGWELQVSTLYLAPIAWVCWVAGRKAGVVLAVVATVVSLTADLVAGYAYKNPAILYWNALMLLAFFLVVVVLLSAFQTAHNQLKQAVQQQTAAVQAAVARCQHVERHVVEISEREQRRIGQDLHDGLGQRLATTRYQLGALSLRLAKKKLPDALRAAEIEGQLQQALEETRQIARGLHPVRPKPEGLMAALQELAEGVTKQSRIPCQLICRGRVLVHDYPAATNLYRIAQEAVNNAVHHAQPKHIDIGLDQADGRFHLRVEDDGQGLPASPQLAGGLGLGIMQYRASSIGAAFTVGPRADGGTLMTCDWMPSPQEAHVR